MEDVFSQASDVMGLSGLWLGILLGSWIDQRSLGPSSNPFMA